MHSNTRPPQSLLYDWAMAVASVWLAAGIFVDAWYHFHNDVESFFEPAHALLYAGMFAAYLFTGIVMVKNHRAGYTWTHSLPAGYGATLIGLALFLAAGVADMIKHELWGIEEGFNALLSPTHLLLGAGMFFILAGPIRSALLRRRSLHGLPAQLPMLIVFASLMELLHWGTQFIFVSEAASMNAPLVPSTSPSDVLTLLTLSYYKQAIGLLAVLVQSILLAGFGIYLKRRFDLAPGGLITLFVIGNAFIAAAHSNYLGEFSAVIVASIASGIVGDLFPLGPARSRPDDARWYAFGFTVPAVYWAVYLGVLAATMRGIWWTPDVVSGSIIYAGLIGAFLNALASPLRD